MKDLKSLKPGDVYICNPNYKLSLWKRLVKLFRRLSNTSILESSEHTLKGS